MISSAHGSAPAIRYASQRPAGIAKELSHEYVDSCEATRTCEQLCLRCKRFSDSSAASKIVKYGTTPPAVVQVPERQI